MSKQIIKNYIVFYAVYIPVYSWNAINVAVKISLLVIAKNLHNFAIKL